MWFSIKTINEMYLAVCQTNDWHALIQQSTENLKGLSCLVKFANMTMKSKPLNICFGVTLESKFTVVPYFRLSMYNSFTSKAFEFLFHIYDFIYQIYLCKYFILVGFGRACAPGRCAHPSILDSLTCKTGRCAPPRPSQLCCFFFTPQNFPLRPELGQSGVRISFHWAKLHPPELLYIASYWATLVHPKSYAAPSELSWILLSYVAPFWATLDPIYSKLSCAL